MKKVIVQTSSRTYPIFVGNGLLSRVAGMARAMKPSRVLVITQKKIARYHLEKLRGTFGKSKPDVYFVPDGEVAKSAKELSRIYAAMLKIGMDRSSLILAMGGGVVGDVAGYAAATYLRGIRFLNIGTTLLAQVDSSIGGKTGINLPEGKNLIGAFCQPQAVISDASVLKTLPVREYTASLAEVVKYGVIRSPQLFALMEKSVQKILKREPNLLQQLIYESSRIKAGVVSRDEFETRGERVILNYGHTFGHAFEQVSGYRSYLHGEAVSIGMVCAARLSVLLGKMDQRSLERIVQLLQALDLPVCLKAPLNQEALMRAMRRDKKNAAGVIRFVLPSRIGSVQTVQHVPEALIARVLQQASGRGAA